MFKRLKNIVNGNKKLNTTFKVFFCFIIIVLLIISTLFLDSLLCYLLSDYITNDSFPLFTEIIIASVAAVLVIEQLIQTKKIEEQKTNIEEANFILQFNQAFIQDKNMCDTEDALEQHLLSSSEIPVYIPPIINIKNKRKFINYLVYLEGLSMFIRNHHIHFENVDDLMGYRFFLVLNNKELQEKEFCDYADYYRACIAIHEKWRGYRYLKGFPIPNEIWGLELWEDYENYTDWKFSILDEIHPSQYKKALSLIKESDSNIYHSLFESFPIAKKRLSSYKLKALIADSRIRSIFLIPDSNTILPNTSFSEKIQSLICSKENIYIICLNGENTTAHIDDFSLQSKKKKRYTCLRSLEILLKHITKENTDKNILLHVSEEDSKINVYKRYGFHIYDTDTYSVEINNIKYILMQKDALNQEVHNV